MRVRQVEEKWRTLFAAFGPLSAEEFARNFIDRFLDFVAEHPAFLQLAASPIRLRRSTAAKWTFRVPSIDGLPSTCAERFAGWCRIERKCHTSNRAWQLGHRHISPTGGYCRNPT